MADQGSGRRSSISGRRNRQSTGTGSLRRTTGWVQRPGHQNTAPTGDNDDDSPRGISASAWIAFGAIGIAGVLLLWLLFGRGTPPPPPIPTAPPTQPTVTPPVTPIAAEGRTTNRPPKAVIRMRQDPADPARLEYSALFSEDPDPGDEERLVAQWDFGDGTKGTLGEGDHRFADGGTYTLTLTMSDPQGAKASATATVMVPVVPRLGGTARTTQVPGLQLQSVNAKIDDFTDFTTLISQAETVTAEDIALAPRPRDQFFGLRFTGYLAIPTAGSWRFTLISDDGGRLTLGDVDVVVMDRTQGVSRGSGTVECSAGLIPLRVDYYQGHGGMALSLEWSGPGQPQGRIPASAYVRMP